MSILLTFALHRSTKPLSYIYLVFNSRESLGTTDVNQLERQGIIKINFLKQFLFRWFSKNITASANRDQLLFRLSFIIEL